MSLTIEFQKFDFIGDALCPFSDECLTIMKNTVVLRRLNKAQDRAPLFRIYEIFLRERETVSRYVVYLRIDFPKHRRLKSIMALAHNNLGVGLQCVMVTKALVSCRTLLSVSVHNLMCPCQTFCQLLSRPLLTTRNSAIRPPWLHRAQLRQVGWGKTTVFLFRTASFASQSFFSSHSS